MTILAPRSALGLWMPGARIPSSLIRAWYDDSLGSRSGYGTWPDRRGAGPNLTFSTLANAYTRKGRPVIQFDGYYGTATFTNAQPFTLSVAIQFTTWGGSPKVIFDGVTTTVRLQRTAENKVLIYAGTNLEATLSASLDNRWVVLAAVFNGANSAIYENGVLRASGNIGSANPTGINVGADNSGTQSFIGYMGELMGVSGALTATQIVEESRFLARKWVS